MIAALLRPRLLGCKNRWRTSAKATRIYRDLTLLTFSVVIMFLMFRATTWGLEQFKQLPLLVHLPISLPLGLLLTTLGAMSIISALAHAIGHLYLADDLDLILASPANSQQLFFGRFLYVAFSVSWMPFVFILPVIAALGRAYEAPFEFYAVVPAFLLPYFVIPAAIATLIATLIMSIIDPRWTKTLVTLGVVGALYAVLSSADTLATVFATRHDPNQVLRLVKTMSAAHTLWLPSTWAASGIAEFLTPSGKSIWLRLLLLYSFMMTTVCFACAMTNLLHGYAYTKARNSSRATSTRPIHKTRVIIRRWSSQPYAIITKEFRMIFRDLAQSSQVIFLSGLCVLYVMNLRIFLALDSFPVESREQWRSIFLVIHAAITAFFTSSLSTRLVFASVSLEGRQFWILQASPLSMRALLESKCVAWFLPISLLSAVLFSIGVFLIFERIETVVLFTALSFFISYSLVSVGIGLGAWFADFTWEHPSQLAMSFGGFIYMVASAILVLGNLMPLTMIVRLTATTPAASSPLATLWMLLVASLVVLANTLIARAAMRLGERSLLRRDTN